MKILMPYGEVSITTPEEAARFIKNKCNNCDYIHTCSGNRSSRCESKLESVIENFFNDNQ